MSVAMSYARALYEAACESESKGELESDLGAFQDVVSHSKEMRVVLLGPVTGVREKSLVVDEVCRRLNMGPLSIRFIALLVKKGRLELLSEIKDAYRTIRLVAEGSVLGSLVTSEPMSESDIDILSKAFGKKLGKKVAFRVSIDPSLLAGMKVTVNGVTYDGTLRSQLQKLSDQFVTAVFSSHA